MDVGWAADCVIPYSTGTFGLPRQAAAIGLRLVHSSNDHVFMVDLFTGRRPCGQKSSLSTQQKASSISVEALTGVP